MKTAQVNATMRQIEELYSQEKFDACTYNIFLLLDRFRKKPSMRADESYLRLVASVRGLGHFMKPVHKAESETGEHLFAMDVPFNQEMNDMVVRYFRHRGYLAVIEVQGNETRVQLVLNSNCTHEENQYGY